MTEESSQPVEVNNEIGKEIGNVVWFDQRKGFGFIKIITPDSEYLDKEVFVHFSSVKSENRFKKLYPGENVSLDVSPNTGDNAKGKEFVCSNVGGLYGTPLLVDSPNYIIKVIRKRENDPSNDDQ
tara:strand:- start:2423 stop:2797 length:375 start_codon:yes stop_codon:yes gene_type:complete